MYMVWFMAFNANFNNISVISWPSIVLMEETGVLVENHRQNLSHNVLSRTPRQERGSNSQFWWSQALIAQVFVNPTTLRSRPRRPILFYRSARIKPGKRAVMYKCIKPGKRAVMYKCIRGIKPGKRAVMYKCIKGIKPGKRAVMYKCIRGIQCASFYDFVLSRFWNDSDRLVLYGFFGVFY